MSYCHWNQLAQKKMAPKSTQSQVFPSIKHYLSSYYFDATLQKGYPKHEFEEKNNTTFVSCRYRLTKSYSTERYYLPIQCTCNVTQ